MKIKELRQITKLSQQQFADKFKIPVNSVRNWEQEKRKPPEYLPGMIEEILRLEAQPISGQQTINYTPMTDTDILNDDAAAAEPTEPKNNTVYHWTKKEKLASNILEYLNDINDINCEDCIYNGKIEECKENDCIMQNHKHYKEIVELIARGAKK